MIFYKRALAIVLTIWLRLFFCSFFLLSAQENTCEDIEIKLTGGLGNIWNENNNSAGFQYSGLSFSLKDNLSMDLNLINISSNLPRLKGSAHGFVWHTNFNFSHIGFKYTIASFEQSNVNFNGTDISFLSEGGRGYFINYEMPFSFSSLEITPSFAYSSCSWDDGELYWFFGKPSLPSSSIYGLSLGYNDLIKHTLGYKRLSADIDINSNIEERLFDIDANADFFYYKAAYKKKDSEYSVMLGWLYAKASLDGELNTSNQPYFLFPYRYYNVTGSYSLHTGIIQINLQNKYKYFQTNISLGALHVFNAQAITKIDYQQKNLFGGNYDYSEQNTDIEEIGAAFFLIDLSLHPISLFPLKEKKVKLSLGLQKAFIIPWGYEKLINSNPDSPSLEALTIIKNILLSGLSINASLSW